MKSFKLAQAVALATSVMLASTTSTFAQEQEQSLETSAEVNCTTTGAYGQNVDCDAQARAEGRQRQVFREDGTVVTVHETADAGLDAASLAVAAGIISTGAGAFALKRKIA